MWLVLAVLAADPQVGEPKGAGGATNRVAPNAKPASPQDPALTDDLDEDLEGLEGLEETRTDAFEMVELLAKNILALVVVIALIYVLGKTVLPRLLGVQMGRGAGANLKVVERLALTPKHTLFVVEAEGRRLLLGGADSGLSLIMELQGDSPGKSFQAVMAAANDGSINEDASND